MRQRYSLSITKTAIFLREMSHDELIAQMRAAMAKMAAEKEQLVQKAEQHRREAEEAEQGANQERAAKEQALLDAERERVERVKTEKKLLIANKTSNSYATCLNLFEKSHTKCGSPEEFGLPSLTEQ